MKKIILSTINADNEFPLALYYLKSYAENHPPKNKEINKNYEIKVKLSVNNHTPLIENAKKLKFETKPSYLIIKNYSFQGVN